MEIIFIAIVCEKPLQMLLDQDSRLGNQYSVSCGDAAIGFKTLCWQLTAYSSEMLKHGYTQPLRTEMSA